jgi:hypothetical protein
MKFTWDFFVSIFYNYPSIDAIWARFETPQDICGVIADGVVIYERIDRSNSKYVESSIMMTDGKGTMEIGVLNVPISPCNEVYRSGVRLYNIFTEHCQVNSEQQDYLWDKMDTIEVCAVLVESSELYRTDALEKLIVHLAGKNLEEICQNPEGRLVNEVFYEEVFWDMSINHVNTRNELRDEVYRVRPTLPEEVVQNIVDYVISTGAVIPI